MELRYILFSIAFLFLGYVYTTKYKDFNAGYKAIDEIEAKDKLKKKKQYALLFSGIAWVLFAFYIIKFIQSW